MFSSYRLQNLTLYNESQKWDPDIIDCNMKMDYKIVIIFGRNIPDTTGNQTAIQVSTSPNITWPKRNT